MNAEFNKNRESTKLIFISFEAKDWQNNALRSFLQEEELDIGGYVTGFLIKWEI